MEFHQRYDGQLMELVKEFRKRLIRYSSQLDRGIGPEHTARDALLLAVDAIDALEESERKVADARKTIDRMLADPAR